LTEVVEETLCIKEFCQNEKKMSAQTQERRGEKLGVTLMRPMIVDLIDELVTGL